MRRLLPCPGPAHRRPAAPRGRGFDGAGGLHAVRFRPLAGQFRHLTVRNGKYDGGTSGGVRLTWCPARDSDADLSCACSTLHGPRRVVGAAGHPLGVSAAVGRSGNVSSAVGHSTRYGRGSTAVGRVPPGEAVFADGSRQPVGGG